MLRGGKYLQRLMYKQGLCVTAESWKEPKWASLRECFDGTMARTFYALQEHGWSQRRTNTLQSDHSYVQFKKHRHKETNKKDTLKYRGQTGGCQRWGG